MSVDIKQLLAWASEAQSSHRNWRKDSWEDYEFRDGLQWSPGAVTASIKKGILPITANKIFPVINRVFGQYLRTQKDIVALGRTKMDSELGQVMSEGIQYVIDQNKGTQKVGLAVHEQLLTGFGCLGVEFNSDPREERVSLVKYPWYSIWWDPYASPWMDKRDCRYAFYAGWKDFDSLLELFPEKANELKNKFGQLTSNAQFVPNILDEGTAVEEYKRYLGASNWANSARKRIRPIEMWYTEATKCWFASMKNGQMIDLSKFKDPREEFAIIRDANQLLAATVKKMRVATFLSDLVLQDIESPYAHDNYPFIPFVGYLDRYDFPFGIPRQIKEQSKEGNKRRTQAMSMINNRRVIVEEGASKNINDIYAEANRQDGLIVVKKGKLGAFQIQELAQMAKYQVDLMQISDQEIKEVSGVNSEAMGNESPIISGVALEQKDGITDTMIALLLENIRYSQLNLGEKIMSLVQDSWTEEKVLRITDRVSGAEKFVAVNEKVRDDQGNVISIRNDITQGRFNITISARPMTATVRAKNMELIFAAINKAPAEAVGPLLNLGLELSDIPSKDAVMKQIRAATGVAPIDGTLTQAQLEEKEKAAAAETKAKQDAKDQAEQQMAQLKNAEQQAKVDKLNAETEEIKSRIGVKQQDVNRKDYESGQKVGLSLLQGGAPR